jgi:hypothetical protein
VLGCDQQGAVGRWLGQTLEIKKGSDCPDLVGRDDKQEQNLILPMQFTAGRGDKKQRRVCPSSWPSRSSRFNLLFQLDFYLIAIRSI